MRAAFVILVTISTAAPVIAAEAPFVPPGITPPDYVATVVEKDGIGGKSRNWTIMHHGEWSRANPDPEQGEYAEYIATNGIVRINVSANDIHFLRDKSMDDEPRNTGERQIHLDETCTVWEYERPIGSPAVAMLDGLAPNRLSCVTDDGIELWQKPLHQISNTSSQQATHIERRPVLAEDTAPPPRLALDWWDQHAPASAASDIPGHEVVLKLSERDPRAATSIYTRRRSGGWQKIDRIVGTQRFVAVTHEPSRLRYSFSTDVTGRPAVLQVTTPSEPVDPAALAKAEARLQPKDLGRSERILNEDCRWFDMTPGMRNVGKTTCLTQDRIALKESHFSRSEKTVWTAVSVARRPVKPDEMKPPAELFDPQTWLR
jgi:hypothetical protein